MGNRAVSQGLIELGERIRKRRREVHLSQEAFVRQFFFLQKTQKEIAQELGIAPPVVSRTIKSAVRRIRRRKPEFPQTTNRIQVGKGGVFHAW